MKIYNPYNHATELGLEVIYGPVSPGNDGEYFEETRRIVLREGLNSRQERCTLAHEIVHAEFHDRPMPIGPAHWKREHRCDRIASERLITADEFTRVTQLSNDSGQWCLELGVTADILMAYIRSQEELLSAVS